jgi:hypothetical protein
MLNEYGVAVFKTKVTTLDEVALATTVSAMKLAAVGHATVLVTHTIISPVLMLSSFTTKDTSARTRG